MPSWTTVVEKNTNSSADRWRSWYQVLIVISSSTPHDSSMFFFGSVIRPLLATRGSSLEKTQLEDGKQTDQSRIEKVIKEYTRAGLLEYNKHVLPSTSAASRLGKSLVCIARLMRYVRVSMECKKKNR